MVVIRLARFGAVHSPKYRITVADQRRAATGKFIDILGHYNPSPKGQEQGLSMDMDKIKDWIGKGAQPTKRVLHLIKKFEGASAQA